MSYTGIIVLTLVCFLTLAALLLVPIYLFLQREEQASKKWTRERLARRLEEEKTLSENGSSKRRNGAKE